MQFKQTYTAQFLSDGSDQLEFDISDPPLNIQGDPTKVTDLTYSPEKVPAAPFIKEYDLEGTKITVTFAAELPETNINQEPATYTLKFTLIF